MRAQTAEISGDAPRTALESSTPTAGQFPAHVPYFARIRAQSTLAHLPAQPEILARFQVVNRTRRVLAEFIAERTPDGCGVVTKVPRRFGSLPESLCHAGSLGVPSAFPPRLLIGLARREADRWVRIKAPKARVVRIAQDSTA